MTALLHPERLGGRALDGAFGAAEVPALLVRIAMHEHSGRLELSQGAEVRTFTFAEGRLLHVTSTHTPEALEHFGGSVEAAAAAEDPTLAAVLAAHARHVVLGAVGGGDGVAWFARHEPRRGAGIDLEAFSAVREAVLRRYDEEQLAAVARAVASNVRALDAAPPLLRRARADPKLLRLCTSAHAATDAELPELGALLLCGLVGLVGSPVTAPSARAVSIGAAPRPAPAVTEAGAPPDAVPTRSTPALAVILVAVLVGAAAGAWGMRFLGGKAVPPAEALAGAPATILAATIAEAAEAAGDAAASDGASAAPVVAKPPVSGAPAGAGKASEPAPAVQGAESNSARGVRKESSKRAVAPRTAPDVPATAAAPTPADVPRPTPAAGPPANTATLLERAATLLNARDGRGALPLLLRARELEPRQPLVHRSLGIAYTLTGDRRAAADSYRRYLALKPDAADRADVQRWLEVLER